ncbi:MAG: DNA gyrase C-terminal beta-propeller domain-containing protein, partial [Aggregatilineales bacterium]
GEAATIPVQQISQVNDPQEGTLFHEVCPLSAKDEIVAMLALPMNLNTGYLTLVTEGAQVKRIILDDLPGLSAKPFKVIKVSKGDRLLNVMLTTGEDDIFLTTAQAQAIRFKEDDVRTMGLAAGGVRGIKLVGQRDRVVSAVIAIDGQYVWTITDDGVAKISPMDDYPTQGRAGSGVITMRLPAESREVSAATIGRQDDNIVVLTSKNKPLYMRVGRAEQVKRGRAGGESVIALRDKEQVVGVVTYQDKIEMRDPEPTADD